MKQEFQINVIIKYGEKPTANSNYNQVVTYILVAW